jgi:hypothetical protein
MRSHDLEESQQFQVHFLRLFHKRNILLKVIIHFLLKFKFNYYCLNINLILVKLIRGELSLYRIGF